MCQNSCNECSRKVYSTSSSVIAINGVNTLVINIPSQSFNNCQRGCLVITQNLPTAATITMPVAISIGGVTTTVYPLVNCHCAQVTACALRSRRRYPFIVNTTATGAVFKVLKNLSCCPTNTLLSIPQVGTATTAAATISEEEGE